MIAFAAVSLVLAASAGQTGTSNTQHRGPAGSPPPQAVGELLACRNLGEPAARLACFDGAAARVASGLERRELVVVDQEQIRSTRRSLFGLSLPRIGILDGEPDVASLEGVIDGVGRNADGGYVFILVGGARWSQIDSRPIALEPRRGDKVTIRRASLGSFMLSVGRQPGVRVKRLG